MEMGSMGEAKTWLLVAGIRGWRSPPRVSFLPLYIFSDFRHPLLGFHQNGPTGRVRTPIGLISGLKSSYGKL